MFELPLFTLTHVVISVLGILAGLVVVGGFIAGAQLKGWTSLFLATTILTSVTGFFFPFTSISPAHIVGALSLVLLVQLFTKTPALAQLAPTQQESPFALTQLLILGLFIWLGRAALRGLRG